MKKTALLLVVALLLSALASCGGDEISDIVSDISASVSKGDTSDDASDTVSDTEVSEQDNRIPVENPEFAAIISTGKAYTNSAKAGESYPDSYSTELTDGQFGPAETGDYTDSKYSGYTDNVTTVTVDLGQVYENIYEFRCGYLSTVNAGISAPAGVKIMASVDGQKFEQVGFCEKPEFVEGVRAEAVLVSEYYVTARYVSFVINKASAWVFLDEVQVIANEQGGTDIDEKFAEQIKNAYTTLGTVEYRGGKLTDKSLSLQLVSKGVKYTPSVSHNSTFSDSGTYLTDGRFTGYFEGGAWVGYDGGESVSFVLDLGIKRDDMSVFKAVCYTNPHTGNNLPVAVTYAVSDNNKEYTDIGRIFAVASGQNSYDFPLILENCASGRYVRITFEKTDTKLYLVEELAVYANTGVTETVGLYPELSFDTTVKNWPNPSTETVNLLSGLSQQINCLADITDENKIHNTPVTSKLLTDGRKSGDNNIHSGAFFKFNGGASREVYFDLGATSAVKTFTAQFTHRPDWAVMAPTAVDIILSENGVDWYVAGTIVVKTTSDDEVVDAEVTLDKAYAARFVCFKIGVAQWCGVSELEAFGTTSLSGAAKLSESGLKNNSLANKGNQAPDKEVLNGASDLVLLYHGTQFDGYTVDELIPYLAYVDKDGKINDTMFDSYLFLLSDTFPSGAKGGGASKLSDWTWSINDLFVEGENILALEEAAGKVKEALSLDDDFKYTFTVTLYYPNPKSTEFGDFDGDGEIESLADDRTRLEAIKWYMDTFEAKLAEYNFKNISFDGYYWYNESIYALENAPYIVTETAKMVHDRGYDFFWIPYFLASGFESWASFDFDVACMQPNYVFKEEAPYSRIEQAAYFTKLYGMGIEIEISGKSFTSDALYKKYLEYLAGGVKYGYMEDCVHMYYQDVLCYYEAAMSKDEKIRLVYDYTYQFIKGTLNAYPEALEEVTVEGSKNNRIEGVLSEKSSVITSFELVGSPENGTVSIAADGTFTYYPNSDFIGTDTFTYVYNEGLCDSEVCTVMVTVNE